MVDLSYSQVSIAISHARSRHRSTVVRRTTSLFPVIPWLRYNPTIARFHPIVMWKTMTLGEAIPCLTAFFHWLNNDSERCAMDNTAELLLLMSVSWCEWRAPSCRGFPRSPWHYAWFGGLLPSPSLTGSSVDVGGAATQGGAVAGHGVITISVRGRVGGIMNDIYGWIYNHSC
jgi:hypothetical protein